MAIKGEDFVKDFDNYMSKILGNKSARVRKQAEKMRKLRDELKTTSITQEVWEKRVRETELKIEERRRKMRKTTFDQALAIARKMK